MDLRGVFATNLRRYRNAKGWSQEEMAHKADLNRTYVSKLETGATYVGLEIVGKLADALEVEASEFLRDHSPRRTQSRPAGRSERRRKRD